MLRIVFLTILPLFISFFLTGCGQEMTERECYRAKWSEKGFQDGYKGRMKSNLERETLVCGRYGVTVNKAKYLSLETRYQALLLSRSRLLAW
jgi:hypothetical protein